MQRHDRRSFLKCCIGLATTAAAGSMLPSDAIAGWFGNAEKRERWLSLGKLADFPDNKKTRVEKAVQMPEGKEIKTPKLIVVREGEKIGVISTRCTHLNCEVNLQEDGSFRCPCHGSAFDKNGAVTEGPARRALPWLEVNITESKEIQVNIEKTVEAPNEG
jgi:menaquinol-cytochrome c reductase iron-sulfur subunit